MDVLRLELFQETACYKKPHALKVSETYPLPPYSTVIGMVHGLLNVEAGSFIPMKLCIQGNYETMFTDYQTHYFFKSDKLEEFPLNWDGLGYKFSDIYGNTENPGITSMPMYRHLLYNVHLYIYISADKEVLEQIEKTFQTNTSVLSLGRAEDLVRVDDCRIVTLEEADGVDLTNSAYVPSGLFDEESYVHIPYKLSSKYRIINDVRIWEKISVGYMESNTYEFETAYKDILNDAGNYNAVFFY